VKAKPAGIVHKYKPAPVVKMITKHSNGTLNLWSVTFADRSKYASLLNINHKARCQFKKFCACVTFGMMLNMLTYF
jgi:hypothetical protein